MYQTAHFRSFQKVYEYARHDYLLQPAKPTIEAEPAYEDIGREFWIFEQWKNDPKVFGDVFDSNNLVKNREIFKNGFFTDYDVRVHAYWDLLSGACGYTYGNNAVWQMFKKGSKVIIPCLYDWRESLDRPGANDIRHLRKLFEMRSFAKLVPDQSIIYGQNPENSTHIRAAMANDGSFLMAYLSVGQPVKVVMKKIVGEKTKAWWFDPREGTEIAIGEFAYTGFQTFTPPTSGDNKDWVLVIDDASKY